MALPSSDPKFDIGGVNGLLLVGKSFDQIYDFFAFEGPPDCSEVPIDFTGFTMSADILDSANVVLDTFTVTPSAGDATGSLRLQLSTSQTTTALRDNAVMWRLQQTAVGTVDQPIIYAKFTVT